MSFDVPLSPEMEKLLARPVAVLGYGVSGKAMAGLLARIGVESVFYASKGLRALHEFDAEAARAHNLVLFSPGFPMNHPWLEEARKAGCRLMGELEFASMFWTGKLICVTGANGKTTIVELLTSLLTKSGVKAMGVGNIGRPLSDVALRPECEDRVAICEVSSFQSESVEEFRCDALLWINFYTNHLDRYGSDRAYFEAKWKILERVRGEEIVVGRSVADAAAKFGYTLPDFVEVVDSDECVPWKMPPESAFFHKRAADNLTLVRRWWAMQGHDSEVVKECARTLDPLPHRLVPIKADCDVTYWNDSKATNYEACRGAFDNFNERKVLWIGGGYDRSEPPQELAESIAPKIRMAFLVGPTAPALAEALVGLGVRCHMCADLGSAVEKSWEYVQKGENVLFSPAHSSYDAFRDYMERGRFFEACVEKLGPYRSKPALDAE